MGNLKTANSYELCLFYAILYNMLGITDDAEKQEQAQEWVLDMIDSGQVSAVEILRESLSMNWN